jgi:RNA ligase
MNEENYQELVKRMEAGLITMRKHPLLDLEICNYTAKTQYNKMWDNYTLICRGLILDSDHNIIAKPFPKFFNLNETPQTTISNLPNEIPKITEKLDGVLGILYPEKNKVAISSRGSFTSDQATWATGWMREKGFTIDDFKPQYTYCFEIIYPGSRIVVNYKDRCELVLLGVLGNKNNHELDHVKEAQELGLSCAREFHFDNLDHAELYLAKMQGIDHEGFVCRYSNGLRLKLKSDDYKRLHKIITGFSEKDVWEALKQGKTLDDMLNLVPDEFYQWMKKTESDLKSSKDTIMEIATIIFHEANKFSTRKEQASYILRHAQKYPEGISAVVFSMLDGRIGKAEEAAWNLIQPCANEVLAKEDA